MEKTSTFYFKRKTKQIHYLSGKVNFQDIEVKATKNPTKYNLPLSKRKLILGGRKTTPFQCSLFQYETILVRITKTDHNQSTIKSRFEDISQPFFFPRCNHRRISEYLACILFTRESLVIHEKLSSHHYFTLNIYKTY